MTKRFQKNRLGLFTREEFDQLVADGLGGSFKDQMFNAVTRETPMPWEQGEQK